MGYFAHGWPKIYTLPRVGGDLSAPPPAPVLLVLPDPTGTYVLTLTAASLHVWSARPHRALLSSLPIPPSASASDGPLVSAAWCLSGAALLVVFTSGRVVLFSIAAYDNANMSVAQALAVSKSASLAASAGNSLLDFEAPVLAADHLARPDVVHPLVLSRLGEARVAHTDATVTSVTSCPAGAIIGTSAGHLVCLSWDLEALWRIHVPELLRNNNALGKMGVLRMYAPSSPIADVKPGDTSQSQQRTDVSSDDNMASRPLKSPRPPIPRQVADIICAAGDDSAGGVSDIAYHPLLEFCGVVLGSGSAVLLGLRGAGTRPPSAQDGRWLCHQFAACIALEPRRMLATVGLANGDVQHHYIGVPAGDVCPVTRLLSLSAWYFEPEDVGPVSVVSWTPDGCALVVGWRNRGLAVWSVSGCRLMWTLPQVGGILPSTPHATPVDGGNANGTKGNDSDTTSGVECVSTGLSHTMDHGVLSAAWGPEGLFLWASPRRSVASHPAVVDTHFTEFLFYKNTSAAPSSCQSESTRRAMFGADRVLFLANTEGCLPPSSSLPPLRPVVQAMPADDEFEWQHLLIPHDYLWQNWPPSRIAVNDDGSHIAVAGKFGVALCAVKSQRWRVFGDIRQESGRIKCCALAWVGSSIVVGNEVSASPVSTSFELLVFSRDEVETSAVQARRPLPARPLIIDVRSDGYLLLICEDSSVVMYKMRQIGGSSRVDMHEMYHVFLPTRETRGNGAAFSQLSISRSTSHDIRDTSLAEQPPGLSEAPGQLSSLGVSASVPALGSARSNVVLGENLRVNWLGRGRSVASGGTDNNVGGSSGIGFRGVSGDGLSLPSPGGGIGVARIFPPLDHAGLGHGTDGKDAPVPTQIMLLRSTGSLVLLDVKHMMSVPLLRYVEHFWYTAARYPPFDVVAHRPVWWAYGDDGTHVCFPDGIRRFLSHPPELANDALEKNGLNVVAAERLASMPLLPKSSFASLRSSASSRGSAINVEQWFDLDPEVYPLGLMSRHGMVLGATQGLLITAVAATDGYEVPSHVIQVKRQPVLHTLLRHLLMKPMSDDRVALQVALNCVNQPQFVDSLEWLLYEAVMEYEDDEFGVVELSRIESERGVIGFPASPRRQRAGSVLFPRVIRLLKYFGEYEDIVVRCARKMDSKRLPLLFSLAGEPAALLEKCFTSGRLRTAACLLVILQEMWGFLSSTPHSLRLVSAALSRGELGLASDLANFLGKASRAGMLDSSQLQVSEDVSWIAEARIVRSGEHKSDLSRKSRLSGRGVGKGISTRIPAVDLAVLQCAERLFSDLELRKLAALSLRMDFPLAAWLTRRVTAAASKSNGGGEDEVCVRDFGSILIALHRQFQYPEPSARAVRRALSTADQGPSLSRSISTASGSGRSRVGGGVGAGKMGANGIGLEMSPRAFAEQAHVKMVGEGADTLFGSVLPPPPSAHESEEARGMRAKARHLCEQELIYLLTIAQTAGACDLCVVFAVLLLDVEALMEALRQKPVLVEPLACALRNFHVPGYDALAEGIDATVAADIAQRIGHNL
jgi:RIC1